MTHLTLHYFVESCIVLGIALQVTATQLDNYLDQFREEYERPYFEWLWCIGFVVFLSGIVGCVVSLVWATM